MVAFINKLLILPVKIWLHCNVKIRYLIFSAKLVPMLSRQQFFALLITHLYFMLMFKC